MGQQVSIETFTSTSDSDGAKYWASFDPYPFKVGSRKLAYLGILNGDGPMKGQKCVVKTTRRDVIKRQDWMLEKKRTKMLREIASAYNKTVSGDERKVCINGTIIAEIDQLSDCMCLNDLIGKPRKKFKEADYVSIELYLKGTFEEFEYGWVDEKDLIVPEAFAHFSWCHSEGNLLASNLQGVKTSKAYHFTGPVIHSDEKCFGTSDIGPEGMKGFFKLHKCNKICRTWPRLGDGVDLRGWMTSQDRTQVVPSAPPSPILPPYHYGENPYHHGENPYHTGENPYQYGVAPYHHPYQHRDDPYQHGEAVSNIEQQHGQVTLNQHTAPWLPNRTQHGMLIDWREEMIYQNMVLGSNRTTAPGFQNPGLFDTQLMWVVKQMSYALYNAPPPPYCLPRDVAAQYPALCDREKDDNAENDTHALEYYVDEDDHKCLLPPPYSEQSVDPQYDRVTYL